MSDDNDPDATAEDVPVRRVTMQITGYLRHGHPVGGWYDMQATATGGDQYSILQSHVDETSIRDAPPERLSDDDWNGISAYVTGRYGAGVGRRLLAHWRRIADATDADRALHPEPEGVTEAGEDDLDRFVREQAEQDPAFASEYVKAQHAARIRGFEDLLASLWLHIGRHEVKQLTTEQKNLLADSVDASSARLAQADPAYGEPREVERWWEK